MRPPPTALLVVLVAIEVGTAYVTWARIPLWLAAALIASTIFKLLILVTRLPFNK